MFKHSKGKTRALFGIIEIAELDVKLYLGLALVVSFLLGILAFRKKEHRTFSTLSIILSVITIILLFIRLWTFVVSNSLK